MNKIKFGKPYSEIIKIKESFYIENKKHLRKALSINNFYKKQKKRIKCKICNSTKLEKLIISFRINYLSCKKCSHLNGMHDDSSAFRNFLYYDNSGKKYSENYLTDFNFRVKKIYTPKLNFLKSTIKKDFDLLDIGCGAGHFVKSAENLGIKAHGYDPNLTMIKLGQKYLKKNKIIHSEEENFISIIKNAKHKTISMLGVLEHVYNPSEYLKAFKVSNAKYLFFKVPLLSLSTFIENSNQKTFPRQLSGGHTHLFTYDSIIFLIKKFSFKIIGEWWFGTDVPDLYRTILINSKFTKKENYAKHLDNYLSKYIDEMQLVLDRNKKSSEIHMVIKK